MVLGAVDPLLRAPDQRADRLQPRVVCGGYADRLGPSVRRRKRAASSRRRDMSGTNPRNESSIDPAALDHPP
jgi:hypothetical protein